MDSLLAPRSSQAGQAHQNDGEGDGERDGDGDGDGERDGDGDGDGGGGIALSLFALGTLAFAFGSPRVLVRQSSSLPTSFVGHCAASRMVKR